jgi:hypothetical protein
MTNGTYVGLSSDLIDAAGTKASRMSDWQGTGTMKLYCQIYIDTGWPRATLIERLSSMTAGMAELRTVTSSLLEIDVVDNEDFETGKSNAAGSFLHYRFYLDIEPRDDVDEDGYVKAVGEILEGLWGDGLAAVAACDFEQRLPRGGGIR